MLIQNLLIKDKDITQLSHFKTKAKTKYYFEVNTLQDVFLLKEILNFAKTEQLPILFVGGGTNLLFAFDVYEGIVIKNNLKGYSYDQKSQVLEVYSSEKIWDIASMLEEKYDQKIWHRFIGLPGSVGGAVFGNAGCFGLETENNFLEAQVYNLETGEIEVLDRKKSEFGYRNSVYKSSEKYFIIKSKFNLAKFEEKYASDVDNIKFRKEVQPAGNSCGSFFKNHSKEYSAGKLIEEVGLKGFHHQNAYFSEKHANFLMSEKENGDYKDLLFLIDRAKQKVKDQFGIELQAEVRIIKNI